MENVEIKEEPKKEAPNTEKVTKKAAKDNALVSFMKNRNEIRLKAKLPLAYSEEQIKEAAKKK